MVGSIRFAQIISADLYLDRREAAMEGPQQSLVDICSVQIDNLSLIGNVEFVKPHFLEKILPQCSLQELARIEDTNRVRIISICFIGFLFEVIYIYIEDINISWI